MLRGRLFKLFLLLSAVLIFFIAWESSLGTFSAANSNAPNRGRKWGKPRPENQEELSYDVPVSPRPTWNLVAAEGMDVTVLDQEAKPVLVEEQRPQQAPLPEATQSTAATSTATVTAQPTDLRKYMVDILRWQRPTGVRGHSPSYEEFARKYYDPNRWEGFQQCVLPVTAY